MIPQSLLYESLFSMSPDYDEDCEWEYVLLCGALASDNSRADKVSLWYEFCSEQITSTRTDMVSL